MLQKTGGSIVQTIVSGPSSVHRGSDAIDGGACTCIGGSGPVGGSTATILLGSSAAASSVPHRCDTRVAQLVVSRLGDSIAVCCHGVARPGHTAVAVSHAQAPGPRDARGESPRRVHR